MHGHGYFGLSLPWGGLVSVIRENYTLHSPSFLRPIRPIFGVVSVCCEVHEGFARSNGQNFWCRILLYMKVTVHQPETVDELGEENLVCPWRAKCHQKRP